MTSDTIWALLMVTVLMLGIQAVVGAACGIVSMVATAVTLMIVLGLPLLIVGMIVAWIEGKQNR
jgi:hypothetical protein